MGTCSKIIQIPEGAEMSYKHLTNRLILLIISSATFGFCLSILMFLCANAERLKLDGIDLAVMMFVIFLDCIIILTTGLATFKLILYIKAYVYEKYETKLGN